MEKDRDHYITEASRIERDLSVKDEEINMKDMLVFDSRKKIIELERKMKEQQVFKKELPTLYKIISSKYFLNIKRDCMKMLELIEICILKI